MMVGGAVNQPSGSPKHVAVAVDEDGQDGAPLDLGTGAGTGAGKRVDGEEWKRTSRFQS